jgi:DUF971 family protein
VTNDARTEIRDAELAEGALQIKWADGHDTTLPLALLRAHCPCATCREIREKPPDPFRVLSPSEAAAVPDLRSIEPVGRYALRPVWRDGHDTGLFTYEYLRELCPCPECTSRRTA